jgi:hypothetical protein
MPGPVPAIRAFIPRSFRKRWFPMANTKTCRFAVIKENKPRCVLSIVEMKSGDLIVDIRGKQLASTTPSPFGTGIEGRGSPIVEYRYTIHTSPDSKTRINTIKLHSVAEDVRLLDENVSFRPIQYTAAIKQTNSFAALYARLCSSLEDPGYDIKKQNAKYESLGYTGELFTLVFCVFVAPRGRLLSATTDDFNFYSVDFKEFSITILWSFLTVPAHHHSRLVHALTPSEASRSPSLNDEECVQYFKAFREQLKLQNLAILKQETIAAPAFEGLRLAVFLRQADPKSPEYLAWLDTLHSRGII